MKNKIYNYIFLVFYFEFFAKSLNRKSKNISIDKKNNFTIFKNDVTIKNR